MRKLLITLTVIAALGTGGVFAQSGYWAGVSAGYPGAQVHFGVENVFANMDVRGNLGFAYLGSYLEVGANVLYPLNVDTGTIPLDVYVGGGPSFGFVFAGALVVGVEAFAGIEYRLIDLGLPEGGVFFEVGPKFVFVTAGGLSGSAFGPMGRLGFNWHF